MDSTSTLSSKVLFGDLERIRKDFLKKTKGLETIDDSKLIREIALLKEKLVQAYPEKKEIIEKQLTAFESAVKESHPQISKIK